MAMALHKAMTGSSRRASDFSSLGFSSLGLFGLFNLWGWSVSVESFILLRLGPYICNLLSINEFSALDRKKKIHI